ncbi:MAG: penicillin-binding transpeptidase domain-containing protein [Candidatus Limivivens sp.]|nr:penicillin-binding transpeptidase domain-containing protein [Candidatus Limivivens sp.]
MAIFAFVLLVLVGLNIRIAYINMKSGDTYTRKVLSQKQYDSQTIPYRRGEIQDRNGNVLARSEKVYNLILDCYQVNSKEEYIEPTIRALVSVMGVEEATARNLITSEETKDSRYKILRKQVTEEEKEALEDYTDTSVEGLSAEQVKEKSRVKGIWFEESYQREYLMDTLASNVIGFSNSQNQGACGVEAYYDDILNGTNGREYGYLNTDSELERTVIEPKHGNTVVMTLDVNIQQIVEKYIAEFDEEYGNGPHSEETGGKGSKNTGVIVMNPNNGEILAMATNHGFDLNHPQDLSGLYTEKELENMSEEEISAVLNDMWSNFCVSEDYEPGSVFKPVTVSAALECGALEGDETFVCDGGEFVTDTQINCDNVYGHGTETISDAIKNSCNDALMQIAFKMGIENFCKYQDLFYFGSRTGIDLPNESTGTVYSQNKMHEVELATSSFGQSLTCTMVQEAAAFSAVINGGYYYRPHVVRQIRNSEGGVVKNIDPVLLRQPISSRTSSLLREYLEQGVLNGTGTKAQVPGYRVGGKTGTAEKYPRGNGKYLVSFIGAAPIDDPQIVVYVVIDEPNVEDQASGGYSMILARKIMMEVLPYLNIPQTEEITEEQLYNLGLTWEEARGGRIIETEAPETNPDGTPVEEETEEKDPNNLGDPENPVAPNPNIPVPLEATDDDGQLPSDDYVTAEEIFSE